MLNRPVVSTTVPYLRSADCNRYGAPVSIDGAEVTFGAATVTRTWCDDSARLMDQKRRSLDILFRVIGFYIHLFRSTN